MKREAAMLREFVKKGPRFKKRDALREDIPAGTVSVERQGITLSVTLN